MQPLVQAAAKERQEQCIQEVRHDFWKEHHTANVVVADVHSSTPVVGQQARVRGRTSLGVQQLSCILAAARYSKAKYATTPLSPLLTDRQADLETGGHMTMHEWCLHE